MTKAQGGSAENNFVANDRNDQVYFGAGGIIDRELLYIRERRRRLESHPEPPEMTSQTDAELQEDFTGLALSGGGIRSASFCLGVMQALAYGGWLKRIDYLSTVSGGGYIGSCLTWTLSQKWHIKDPNPNSKHKFTGFGVERTDFPLGFHPIASESEEEMLSPLDRFRGHLIRYLRQHGRYLLPGNGLDSLSLVTVLLRNVLYSLTVFILFLMGVFFLLGAVGLVPPRCMDAAACPPTDISLNWFNLPAQIAIWILVVWAGLTLLSIVFGITLTRNLNDTNYRMRRAYETVVGRWPLKAALAFLLLGALLGCYTLFQHSTAPDAGKLYNVRVESHMSGGAAIEMSVAAKDVSGAGGLLGKISAWSESVSSFAGISGTLSSVVGVLLSLFAFRKSSRRKDSGIPLNIVVWVASATLIFGVVLVAYHLYVKSGIYLQGADWVKTLSTFSIWVLFISVVRFTNINDLSLHRYYRDRLMETFLPDTAEVVINALDPESVCLTLQANDTVSADSGHYGLLSAMCPQTGERAFKAPYHILNANVVLASSDVPKYRGRGGDNYIFSPLYSGSCATGWRVTGSSVRGETDKTVQDDSGNSRYNGMTLATAMAISGAAINPNTGTGGKGVMRQRMLSFLMGILNIRLGYWVRNPAGSEERRRRVSRITGRNDWDMFVRIKALYRRVLDGALFSDEGHPNGIHPMLTEILGNLYLDENSRWLQLSDGGHFENLGLYELVRRRLKYIVVCDGTGDRDFTFSDLGNAIERVRADFGARIDISAEDLQQLIPVADADGTDAKGGYATRGYLIADIKYAAVPGQIVNRHGKLIYLTTTFFKELTADLKAYRNQNNDFPDQMTMDQFFDEQQFEAYRELGYQTAYQLMTSEDAKTPGIARCFGPAHFGARNPMSDA